MYLSIGVSAESRHDKEWSALLSRRPSVWTQVNVCDLCIDRNIRVLVHCNWQLKFTERWIPSVKTLSVHPSSIKLDLHYDVQAR